MTQFEKTRLLGSSRTSAKNEDPWVSVFNLCNSCIGAGVLSFPYGFRQTGLVGGLFFSGLIWVVEVFTLCILIRVAEKRNSQSYQHLVCMVLGHRWAVVTSVVMLFILIAATTSYLIISGDVFTPIFAGVFGVNTILGSRRVVILLFTLLVILPLSLQTSLKALKYTSMLTVIMLTYLTFALVLIGVVNLLENGFPTDVLIFRAGKPAFIIIDIVVFAFECHIQVVPIFAELAERPKPFFKRLNDPLEEHMLDEEVISELSVQGRRSERVKRMDGVIFFAMSTCFISYCLVGVFGYLLFQDVESDVLKSFGKQNVFMNIARVGMAVVALVCYPVQHHPARSIIDDAVKYVAKVPAGNFSWIRHVLITLGFLGFTLGIALVVTDVGKVFSIVGSTGGVMVVFLIPGILLILGAYNTPSSTSSAEDAIAEEEGAVLHSRSTSSPTWLRVFGGISMIVFGCGIFSATVYVIATGLV